MTVHNESEYHVTARVGWADETLEQFQLRQAHEQIDELNVKVHNLGVYERQVERALAQTEQDAQKWKEFYEKERREGLFGVFNGERKDRPFPYRAIAAAFIVFDIVASIVTILWTISQGAK